MALMKTAPSAQMTVAVITATVIATLACSGTSIWVAVTDDHALTATGFNAAVVLAFTVVGAVIAAARPNNRIGWLMLGGGFMWALGGAATDLAYHGIQAAPGSVPAASALAVGGSAA